MNLTSLIVPFLLVALVLYGLIRGVDVYAAFVEGASSALPTLFKLLPYLAAMLVSVELLSESGAFLRISDLLSPLCAKVGLDASLLPLLLVRPFSGSAAMAMVNEICLSFGPDSREAFTAAILTGSSETILYELAVYFGAVNVKKTRFAAPVAFAAMLVSILITLLIVPLYAF